MEYDVSYYYESKALEVELRAQRDGDGIDDGSWIIWQVTLLGIDIDPNILPEQVREAMVALHELRDLRSTTIL